ncbi:hypothetical protein C8J57DRAFT_1468168, partial [Mycena rebaudengoi]
MCGLPYPDGHIVPDLHTAHDCSPSLCALGQPFLFAFHTATMRVWVISPKLSVPASRRVSSIHEVRAFAPPHSGKWTLQNIFFSISALDFNGNVEEAGGGRNAVKLVVQRETDGLDARLLCARRCSPWRICHMCLSSAWSSRIYFPAHGFPSEMQMDRGVPNRAVGNTVPKICTSVKFFGFLYGTCRPSEVTCSHNFRHPF